MPQALDGSSIDPELCVALRGPDMNEDAAPGRAVRHGGDDLHRGFVPDGRGAKRPEHHVHGAVETIATDGHLLAGPPGFRIEIYDLNGRRLIDRELCRADSVLACAGLLDPDGAGDRGLR